MSKIIGLTGPIAAGKDTVAKILRRRGAFIIDADKVAHALYDEIQSPVWQEIIKIFGSKILLRGGKINRKKLGEIVFSNKKKLAELNRIVHPYLRKKILKEVGSRKQNTGDRAQELIVINAAVLKEIGLIDLVDEVWTVLASPAIRLKRLLAGGLTKPQAQQRLKAQASDKEYQKIAEVIIRNNGTKKQLNVKIRAHL
jgi:dephospho-CoA kinase